MNLNKLKEILKLSSTPAWALRDPDLQQAQTPEKPTPQGVAGKPMQQKPAKPGVINAEAMNKISSQVLPGGTGTEGIPTQPMTSDAPSGLPSLSQNIQKRMLSKKANMNALPGSITGGF